ncbi:DUF4376 domain-containing protein [Glaesserella parasuis]|uniref:DUF4376 domain-containing protein n=1 Tax=Glaesserella parasuis TaxID=738 RepID=UPI002436670B|nr:DUF4376 domain-containing protein [Glaesserella parasuis]MDG6310499.1 DUF4376 domain-containing protein [Glaesserella parasuis]
MAIFYKDGFYNNDHGGFVPEGACEISEETYRLLLEGQAQGKLIVADDEGLPILVEPAPMPIEEQRQKIRNAINTKRDQTDAGGVFVEALGKWVDSDEKAYQNILGVKASLDLLGDMDIPWTWADNSSSIINRTMLAAIVGALLQAKQQNHANALKHKAAVEQSENPLDYDYSGGWTQTYEEYQNA